MDGRELLYRVVTTVQEMYLKIGDSCGSVSLYYPFGGDPKIITEEFREASRKDFPELELDILPERLRVVISEKDCRRISKLPVKATMRDMTSLVRDHAGIDDFRELIEKNYPGARLVPSGYIDFDWILVFPEDVDEDVYCLSEEMGSVTYHRFSREEFASLGFEIEG